MSKPRKGRARMDKRERGEEAGITSRAFRMTRIQLRSLNPSERKEDGGRTNNEDDKRQRERKDEP